MRQEDRNPLAEEAAAVHHPADVVQPLLFHHSFLPRCLHVELRGEAKQEDGRQGSAQLSPPVLYVHSHHYDGDPVRHHRVQRGPAVLQGQQEPREHSEKRQDHESIQEGSWIRCVSSNHYSNVHQFCHFCQIFKLTLLK